MRFTKILIANRGEIACRIARTARAMGYRSVSITSEPDRTAPHAMATDENVHIGGYAAAENYLNSKAILAAARKSGADAIHPGYGFLSENAAFAEACRDAGLVFIGPSPEAIAAMGDKGAAKKIALAAGIPCLPGYEDDKGDDAALIKAADTVGYPLMVKAAAGGGGRGMRLVERPADLAHALAVARGEAMNAFQSRRLILERALIAPRHIEIQVFGDNSGHILYLGERDCSTQRHHQKVIEESPAPGLSSDLRQQIGNAAVALAHAVHYVGAGTVEFLLDAGGRYYFLEMNTRLQVEHPVTEQVTGLDLVAWQLDVAAGRQLPYTQADITLQGHAIEVRLYAEDPRRNYLPQTGRLVCWQAPTSPGIRVDSGIISGQQITPYYDPMLAKLIVHALTRDDARRQLIAALDETTILGLTTNKSFLLDILRRPEFEAGVIDIHFLDRHFGKRSESAEPSPPPAKIVALATVLIAEQQAPAHLPDLGWSSSLPIQIPFKLGEAEGIYDAKLVFRSSTLFQVSTGGQVFTITLPPSDPVRRVLECDGHRVSFDAVFDNTKLYLDVAGEAFCFIDASCANTSSVSEMGTGLIKAPMSGQIVAVNIVPGATVAKGQCLILLEAMKMQHEIVASVDGVIQEIFVGAGAHVAAKQQLVQIEPMAKSSPGAA